MGQDNEKQEQVEVEDQQEEMEESNNQDEEYLRELLNMFNEPSNVNDKEYRIFLKKKTNLTLKNVKIMNETIVGKKEVGVSIDHEKFEQLEDKMIDAVVANCSQWFPGKNISEEFIHSKFMSHERRHNVIQLERLGSLAVFNYEKEKLDLQDIDTSKVVDIVLTVHGLNFGKKEWNIIYKISQIRQKVEKENDTEYLFDEEDEEEEEEDFF